MDYSPLCSSFPGKNTGMDCHFLLRGIFQTQGLNPRPLCLLHWQLCPLPLAARGEPTWEVCVAGIALNDIYMCYLIYDHNRPTRSVYSD